MDHPPPGTPKFLGINTAEIKPSGRTYKTASLRFYGDDPESAEGSFQLILQANPWMFGGQFVGAEAT